MKGGMGEQRDSLERFTLTFKALPGTMPLAVRVRRFLKLALRRFGLVSEGFGEPVSRTTAHRNRKGDT
jgi:hypothetical protein